MNSGTLDTDGNYSNSGTFTSGTSTFKLSGNSAQSVTNTNLTATIPNAGTTTLRQCLVKNLRIGHQAFQMLVGQFYHTFSDCTNG